MDEAFGVLKTREEREIALNTWPENRNEERKKISAIPMLLQGGRGLDFG